MQSQVKKKPEDELPDMSGTTVCKKYLLKRQAGQGAHGMVYLGKEVLTNCPVAVKVVSTIHLTNNNNSDILIS